jgi:hypothetical protein
MGLLDEAIKDHLELKRRHGADPGEVARLEHEALGPARREPTAAPEPLPEEPALGEDDDEVPANERLDAPSRRIEHDPAAPDPEPESRLSSPDQSTRPFSLDELDEATDAPPARRAEPSKHDEPEDDEPQPRGSADVVPADDEPEGEDVLEETPEFLQETPEHDRLWFEQKPPKDFDF